MGRDDLHNLTRRIPDQSEAKLVLRYFDSDIFVCQRDSSEAVTRWQKRIWGTFSALHWSNLEDVSLLEFTGYFLGLFPYLDLNDVTLLGINLQLKTVDVIWVPGVSQSLVGSLHPVLRC